ncbi:MAG: hypothetical protein P8X57_11710 [Cyclobacteriaceae bacterium]
MSNHETFSTACKYSSGAIIGSAFIKVLHKEGASEKAIMKFIGDIKNS